VQMLY